MKTDMGRGPFAWFLKVLGGIVWATLLKEVLHLWCRYGIKINAKENFYGTYKNDNTECDSLVHIF